MKWSDFTEQFDRVQTWTDIVLSSVHWVNIQSMYCKIDWSQGAFTVCVCMCVRVRHEDLTPWGRDQLVILLLNCFDLTWFAKDILILQRFTLTLHDKI